MRFTPRTWSLLSLALFVAAIFFWLKGNEYEARRRKAAPAILATNTAAAPAAKLDLFSTKAAGVQLARLSANSPDVEEKIEKLYPERLRNTPTPFRDLVKADHAILLANALIDTDSGEPLNIPAHLRAKGDSGSYIVQWNGAANSEFRARLADAGAEIVSYVPNNAYFVKVSAEGAQTLGKTPGVQAVVPFEPYFKLQERLLATAVKKELLPAETLLRVTLLPGAEVSGSEAVKTLGARIVAEETSPFGPQLVIAPPVDALPELARLADVQGIELASPRKAASDLSLIVLGVATNSAASNYLNPNIDLSGSNIWVNINDTGIDTNSPALQTVRIAVPAAPLPMAGTDPEGHGTFVASLIAGSGAQSPTNVPGSLTNASFRGIAPLANLLALPLDAGGGTNKYPVLSSPVRDQWLIETAARSNYITLNRTNTLISNNSWTYGSPGYDSAAARFDAAVRDAIPGMSGSQPLLFVFAAGNSGFGSDEGDGGQVDSIESPGTAKNVITVGALENYRLITNIFFTTTNTEIDEFTGVTNETVTTNYPFAAETDSSNQVASFSSRGNVGIGIEGVTGRFKPDVVAPGTMLVGARSQGWDFFGLNTNEGFGQAIFNLHTNIDNKYRLDSGTTFAAANISGMLALIQQYFETQAPTELRGALSPAMMKAILVNGSRSLTELYDLALQTSGNYQGWGLPYLPNMLSSYSTNTHKDLDVKKWRMRLVDQSPTNALATGQSRTWKVTLSTNALVFPFRVTLAWTDPPGNPAVGVKLVNDLDLVITNLESGTVFYGNDIPPDADFNNGNLPTTNSIEPLDFVNNVENVAIRNPKELGKEFTITVRARRVNVNSVNNYLSATGNTNDVVQDFALVVSSDMGADPSLNDASTYVPDLDVFDSFESPKTLDVLPRVGLTSITNGLPLLTERVGANATLVGTNGITNQWNFYVFTNITVSNSLVYAKAGSNVAFVTFSPPNLSKSRNLEADIDLYVSKDSRLTNLVPAAVGAALKSTEAGGTETIVLTNAVIGDVYYVAVKSEDQQAAEFSLIGVSSDLPFEEDRNGASVLRGVPIYSYVPDGTARKPVAGTMLAIGISNRRVARTVASTTVIHENFGDLVGVLSHSGVSTILNNHALVPLTETNFIYDDNLFYGLPKGWRRSDGPGTLNDFAGRKITGAWFLEEIDNAPSHTGRVENVTLTIDKLQNSLLSGVTISATNQPGETKFFPIDVGPGVTNLTFHITNNLPLEVYFRQFELPQTNLYDLKTNAAKPSTTFAFPTTNSAPLSPGTHYLAVRNPNSAAAAYTLRVDFGFGVRPGDTFDFAGQAPSPRDDATTNTTIFVQNDKLVAKAEVSLWGNYPRISDLVFSLVSPQGSRVLLSENRGGTNTSFGTTYTVTNAVSTNLVNAYTIFTDNTNLARVPIKFAFPIINQNKTNTGIISSNSFETTPVTTLFPGDTAEGAWIASGFLDGLGQGGFAGNRLLSLYGGGPGNESGITRPLTTRAGATYKVTVASRVPGRDYLYWTERSGSITNTGTNFLRRVVLATTNSPGGTVNFVETLTNSAAIGAFGGVSVDALGGYVYSGDRRFLFRTDLVGKQRTNLVATQNAVADVEVDPANGWVYWAESGPFTRTNSIKRARTDGKNVQVLLQLNLGDINGIALDVAKNTLYFTLSLATGRDTIQAIDLGTRQRRVVTLLSSATVDPFDIDLDTTTQTLVFNQIGDHSIWLWPLDGSGLKKAFTSPFALTNGIALDTARRRVIFSAGAALWAQDLATTNSTATALLTGRQQVIYPEVVHGIQGTNAPAPLVAQISLGSVTNHLVGTTEWANNTFYFVGAGGTENLTIQANEGDIWIDNVIVERVPDTFVQPEEPLETLVGERALGEWRLQIQDVRSGAVVSSGFEWKLHLDFADPVLFAETLTGGSRFSISTRSTLNSTNRFRPGLLRNDEVHYFVIQPCAGAQNLTVFLGGVRNFDAIDLLADTSGFPTGDPNDDDFALMRNNQNPGSANGVLEFHLSDKLPAPAHLTAKPIFIAIRNRYQEMTNLYQLVVTSDGNCTPLEPSATPLSANVSEVGGLASASDYSDNQMGLHALNVPAGAQSVRVSVEADADVSIIAQKDEPPTTDSFSILQSVPGAATEELVLNAGGSVPLTPGRWYVRVLNDTEKPISYTITATGDLSDELNVLSVLAEMVDGSLRLSWNASAGADYEVQGSTDLVQWSPVTTILDGSSSYVVPDASGPARFYRVVQK